MTTTEPEAPGAVPEHELRLARWLYPLLTLALGGWISAHPLGEGHGEAATPLVGEWFSILDVGSLNVGAGCYIDALTVVMAVVVTLIAT